MYERAGGCRARRRRSLWNEQTPGARETVGNPRDGAESGLHGSAGLGIEVVELEQGDIVALTLQRPSPGPRREGTTTNRPMTDTSPLPTAPRIHLSIPSVHSVPVTAYSLYARLGRSSRQLATFNSQYIKKKATLNSHPPLPNGMDR